MVPCARRECNLNYTQRLWLFFLTHALHGWMDRSATAAASASVGPASVQTPSSKGQPVRQVRPGPWSLGWQISKSFSVAWNSDWSLSVHLCDHTAPRTVPTPGHTVNKVSVTLKPTFKSKNSQSLVLAHDSELYPMSVVVPLFHLNLVFNWIHVVTLLN